MSDETAQQSVYVLEAVRDLTRRDAANKTTTVQAVINWIAAFYDVVLGAAQVRDVLATLREVRERVADGVAPPAPVRAPAPARPLPTRVTLSLTLDLVAGEEARVVKLHAVPASDFDVRVATDFRGDDETLPLHVFVTRRAGK